MLSELKELYKYKDLLQQLISRDLKVRYKNSVLGFFWSLLNPLVQVATITILVKYVMRLDINNYSAYLLVGYLPWIFFQMTLLDSSQVILSHRDLIKKTYFPREVLPLSVVIANVIHFMLALVVFFAYLLFYRFFLGGSPILKTALLVPYLLFLQFLLLCGLTFIVSSLNAFFEDTKYILAVLLNVFFYVTPIMFPVELLYSKIPIEHRSWLFKIYMLNPINTLISSYRKCLLPGIPIKIGNTEIPNLPMDYAMLGWVSLICVLVAIGGYAFFNSKKWLFAERA